MEWKGNKWHIQKAEPRKAPSISYKPYGLCCLASNVTGAPGSSWLLVGLHSFSLENLNCDIWEGFSHHQLLFCCMPCPSGPVIP